MPKPPGAMQDPTLPNAPAEPQAAPGAFKFKEPKGKVIGQGFEQKELRKLTPEEKAARRIRWNLTMALIGLGVLGLLSWALYR